MSLNGEWEFELGETVRHKEHPSLGTGVVIGQNRDGTFRVQCERNVLESVFPESLVCCETPPPALYMKSELARNSISCLWHITNVGNLASICESGILSHTSAYERVRNIADISDAEVQKHRALCEPIFRRRIHEYASLYFVARNPMLYKRRAMRDSVVLLEIRPDFLTTQNCIFTDGNAASRDTNFYNDIASLTFMPWDVLHANYWNNFADGKRKRCAEILVYPSVPVTWIERIHCATPELVKRLKYLPVPAVKNRDAFFSKY